jgi:general secretion pathway protein G
MFSPTSLVLRPGFSTDGLTVPDRDAPRAAGRRLHRPSAGFSLLEILVVLAIIGLIVGVAMSNLTGIFSRSQVNVAKLFVNSEVEIPLTSYRVDVGDYPTNDDGGLNALWVAPSSKADRWHGPYAKGTKAPLDPWGHPYQYRYPGTHNKGSYDIWSTGPGGVDGSDDNIGNW